MVKVIILSMRVGSIDVLLFMHIFIFTDMQGISSKIVFNYMENLKKQSDVVSLFKKNNRHLD